jgi:hypothetical protein
LILLLITACTGIVLLEIPSLIRKKYWRELVVFAFFQSTAFILALPLTLGIKLPSLTRGMEYVFRDLLHLSYK